jgi:hypothetical protein
MIHTWKGHLTNNTMARLVRSEGYITRFLEGKRKQPAGSSLYHLRDTELDAGVATILAPFINAYRPHGEVPKRDNLKAEGYELVRSDTFTDDLKEVYWGLRGYYPGENPDLARAEADG